MQPHWRRCRKTGVWWNRSGFGVCLPVVLVVLIPMLAGCADDQGSAVLSGITVTPAPNDAALTESADSAEQTPDQEVDDLEEVTSNEIDRPSNFGATVEIDDFFFAPIGFPGFGAVSGNCNLDDDPYGACL